MSACCGSQRHDCGSPAATSVSASQARPAPQVIASRAMKSVDRIRDCRHVRAFHKPDAAAEALVEHASLVAVQTSWNRLLFDVLRPMEIAFVKAVTIDCKPTE